jgi:hypothetical protein
MLCLALALPAGEAGLVLTTRGTVVAGPLGCSASGVTAGAATVAFADLGAFALPGTPATAMAGGIVTSEGEILRGLPLEITNGSLRWNGDLGGPNSRPLDRLAAIICGPMSFSVLASHLASESGAVLVNGERISGTLAFFNAEAIGLDTGRRVAQLPRARVAAVVLRPVTAAGNTQRTWLQLITGDRILAGGAIEPAAQAVCAGWGEGPNCRPLAGLAPRRALATDRQAAALPVSPGLGFPTVVGGLAAPTGVHLPARGEIAWDSAGFTHLLAWVACPAGSDATVAAVALDGTVAWEQTLQPGAPAVPVALLLRGAAEVALRSGPGADGETARRQVAWAMPTLVR